MISPIGSNLHRQRSSNGFTLLELLAVILVLTVVAGLSVPRFRRTFSHLQVQVFAHEVAQLLTLASHRAIARQEILRVHFDVEGRRYWLAQVRESVWKGEPERVASKMSRLSSVPETISFVPSKPEVTFYPDGRADRFELAIYDNGQDGIRIVTDIWTGRPKLLESNGRYGR